MSKSSKRSADWWRAPAQAPTNTSPFEPDVHRDAFIEAHADAVVYLLLGPEENA